MNNAAIRTALLYIVYTMGVILSYKSRFWSLILLTGLLLYGCKPPPEPDYSKPGRIGSLTIQDNQVFLTTIINKEIPRRIACDSTVLLTGIAYEELGNDAGDDHTCDSYEYDFLYDEAFNQANDRGKELKCEQEGDGCYLEGTIIKQKLSCKSERAEAEITIAFRCFRKNEKPPAGLRRYRLDEITTEEIDETLPNAPQVASSEILKSMVDYRSDREYTCPEKWDLAVLVSDSVSDCNQISSYEPYVKMAHASAARAHARTTCHQNCYKINYYETTGLNWQCNEGTSSDVVKVVHVFNVYCWRND